MIVLLALAVLFLLTLPTVAICLGIVFLIQKAAQRREEKTESQQRSRQSAFDGALSIPTPLAGAFSPHVTPELSLTALAEVQDLLRQQRKIEAIKMYKEETGVGLKDAKDAVEAIERSYTGQFAPITQTLQSEADAREDILALVREGHKIQAIKRYREQTGVGLAAAREVIEGVAQGEELPPLLGASLDNAHRAEGDALGAVPLDEIRALLRQGQKIHAIKLYRDHTLCGLKEAKDAVEAIERIGL